VSAHDRALAQRTFERTWLALACLGAFPACRAADAGGGAPAAGPLAVAETRIEVAEHKLAAAPLLYPVWAELGEARLDRARVTRAPEDVHAARDAFRHSLALQENAVALRGMIALENYRHRFAEALTWVPRARAAWPEDSTVLGLEVEALLSLAEHDPRRLDEARSAVARRTIDERDFHARAARARLWLAEGRVDDAAQEFLAAADVARSVSAELARWAVVRAAAAWIDTGSPERATPLLAECLAAAPDDVDALVHHAEACAGLGDDAAALAAYERALTLAPDPMLHASAAPLAAALGDAARAAEHAAIAERELTRAITAGEEYTQNALDRMHAALEEHAGEASHVDAHTRGDEQ
jgi:tetratricopeptide (TPR) repeat protein